MFTEADFRIHPTSYEWTSRTLALLEKVLRVRIRLHHRRGQLEEGEIFLFNHFARFETFIPQYLIYRETGALCRSVAGAEFFREDDAFSRYLLGLGAVDETHPLSLRMLGMHGSVYSNYAVEQADLLIALGVRFDDRVTGKVEETGISFAQARIFSRSTSLHIGSGARSPVPQA